MLNKTKRNKIKIRSTKKKYKQKTRKNCKYGGGTKVKPVDAKTVANSLPPVEEVVKRKKKYGKTTWVSSDYPTIAEKDIRDIRFEIPKREKFNSELDNYKFLEMADRDMTTDMYAKLIKTEVRGGIAPHYCKYMYLIRATHHDTGNTVLHYICNRRSVEMLEIVFPYYLILYNKDFPELLSYYITKKNKIGLVGQTPLDLLDLAEKNTITNSLDYEMKAVGALGALKNVVQGFMSTENITTSLIRNYRRAGNAWSGRVNYIREVLTRFIVDPNKNNGANLPNEQMLSGSGNVDGTESASSRSDESLLNSSRRRTGSVSSRSSGSGSGSGSGTGSGSGAGREGKLPIYKMRPLTREEEKQQEQRDKERERVQEIERVEAIEELRLATIEEKESKKKYRNRNNFLGHSD